MNIHFIVSTYIQWADTRDSMKTNTDFAFSPECYYVNIARILKQSFNFVLKEIQILGTNIFFAINEFWNKQFFLQ